MSISLFSVLIVLAFLVATIMACMKGEYRGSAFWFWEVVALFIVASVLHL